jgi:hypothetical protein
VTLVASKGITGAQESARAITQSKDASSSRSLKVALDVYWRYIPTPHSELEHAQSEYLCGILAYAVDGNKTEFKRLLHDAISLLSTVEPDRADSQMAIEFIIASKAKLQVEWEGQLANLK